MDKKKYRYGGREFRADEIEYIKALIENSPTLLRAALSRLVCEHLDWRKLDGGLKDMRCRAAMLAMDKVGLICLPPPQNRTPAMVKRPIAYSSRSDWQTELKIPVHELGDITLHPVLDRESAKLWNEYVDRYHYLGHKTLPGAQMRFIAMAANKIIGLLGFGSAAWKTAPRDNFIGWDAKTREKNLYLIVNNARFLIPPWIRSKNLASKLLAMSAKELRANWLNRYGYTPVLLETFVEVPRFTGCCYKAANWIKVGRTTGRGKMSTSKRATLPKKDVWLYPLQANFKTILCK